jgi:hypothetical protein
MVKPKIYADFRKGNWDADKRLRLNNISTFLDLSQKKIELSEGLEVILHDNKEKDAWVYAKIERSLEENIWVAVIDWENSRYRSGSLMYNYNTTEKSEIDYKAFLDKMYDIKK